MRLKSAVIGVCLWGGGRGGGLNWMEGGTDGGMDWMDELEGVGVYM